MKREKPKFVLPASSQVDFALLGVLKAQMMLNDNKAIQAYKELDDVKALLGSFIETHRRRRERGERFGR